MSIKVKKICVYKDGAWHPITKVYKDGWKKFRGLFYDGNWYEIEEDDFPGTYFEEYGALYNWWALDGLANDGWRVPSNDDWITLEDYIDTNYNTGEDEFGIGNHLKSCRQVDSPLGGDCDTSIHPRWNSATEYGRDSVKFSGMPGGKREPTEHDFRWLGDVAYWWSATVVVLYEVEYGYFRSTSIWISGMEWDVDSKQNGFAVRLLRNATTNEQDIEHEDYIAEETIIPNEYTGHDEKTYDAVRIGTQVWITENLKETKKHEITSDWYLPSIMELQAVYDNLHNVPEPIGDFSSLGYGSSTENGANGWEGINFNDGSTLGIGKIYKRLIRPVRHVISSNSYDIKDEIGGGYVFYIEDLGGGEYKYYIVSKVDNEEYLEFEVSHGEYGTDLGTGENIGDGEGNTNLIIDDVDFDGQYPAAEYCDNLDVKGEDLVDIPIVTDNQEWSELDSAAMCAYPKP